MNNDPREDEKMKKYFAVTVLMMVCFGISACNVNVNVKADPEKEENIDLETDIDEPISGTYDEDGYEKAIITVKDGEASIRILSLSGKKNIKARQSLDTISSGSMRMMIRNCSCTAMMTPGLQWICIPWWMVKQRR